MHSKPYHCFDCDCHTPVYSVRDHVWLKAWPDYHEEKQRTLMTYGEYITDHYEGKRRHPMNCLCLCFPCLEKRLGRNLTLDDFDETRANDLIRFGFCLARRPQDTLQGSYAIIRSALLQCITQDPKVAHPVPTVYPQMPENIVYGDVLSVWEALVDNHVVTHTSQGWSKAPGADTGIFP